VDGNLAILHALPVPALIVGIDGTVLDCNDDGARWFGGNGSQPIGRKFNDLALPSRDPGLVSALGRAADTGNTQEVLLRPSDPRRACRVRIGILRDPEAVAGFIVTAEVGPMATERSDEVRRLKDELRERLHELNAARRTDEERKHFLAMLAHELRSPLAALAGAVKVLRARRVGNGDVLATQALRVAERQIAHQTRMLEDLLVASRVVLGKILLRREVLELTDVVRQATESVSDDVRTRAQDLQLSLPSEPMWVEADETRLDQIFTNLLGNAVKFTGPGGRIAVAVENEGDAAVIRVCDDGIGMEPEVLDKVFDLFTQADTSASRAAGGLGIGLSLARHLVEMHGGTIAARSMGRGHGSEFEVRLPRAVGRPSATPAVPSPESSPPSPRKILVVDDNRDAREMLRALLELHGHRVETASDGRQAVKLAVERLPDVALIDIGLPGMDGYEVARQIRHRVGPAIRLMALTGYGDEEAQRLTREAGFSQHFVKPVDVDRLARLIAAA
jgi:signal transduction histidine kinase